MDSGDRSEPGRLLVVRVGAMGDALHALPAVAALRAMRPELPVDWVVDPRWAPLLVGPEGTGPLVARVYLAETRRWSRAPFSAGTVRSVLGLRNALREGHYGAVVDVQGTLRSAVLGRFAGARRFAGFADPREAAAGWFYRKRYVRRGTHVVEQNAALLGDALGVNIEPVRSPELPRVPEAEAWAAQLLGGRSGPVVLLAPSAGWGAKQWPAERFAALAGALRGAGMRVLVNAASGADPVAQAVTHDGGAELVACSVSQLVALTRRMAVVVGGDSGPVHMAAALGVACVGLYGPTDPARNGPWGAGPVRVLRSPESVTSFKRARAAEAGLLRLGVAEVLEAVLGMVG